MKISCSRRLASAIVFPALLVVSSVGCTVFRPAPNVNSQPLDPETAAKLSMSTGEGQTQEEPQITVAIKPEFGRRKNVTLPLEEGMALQDVLQRTRVTRRFRDMKLTVMRVTPQSNGVRVPLQAEYDSAKNRVGILHDMTLYPGDHIVIIEENRTRDDEALGSLFGAARR